MTGMPRTALGAVVVALAVLLLGCSGEGSIPISSASPTPETTSPSGVPLSAEALLAAFELELSDNSFWQQLREIGPDQAVAHAETYCSILAEPNSVGATGAALMVGYFRVAGEPAGENAAFEFAHVSAAVAAEHVCPELREVGAEYESTLSRLIDELESFVQAAPDYWWWVEADEFVAYNLSKTEWLTVGIEACRRTEIALSGDGTFADVEASLIEIVGKMMGERDIYPPDEVEYTASNAQSGAYNELCPQFLDASHEFWRAYDRSGDQVDYLTNGAANDAYLQSLEDVDAEALAFVGASALLAMGADACDSFAYDFGNDLMREVTDLVANTTTYEGLHGEALEAYKALRLRIPPAALDSLCPSLEDGVRPLLAEWATKPFEPDVLSVGRTFYDLPPEFSENLAIYEDLRSEDRETAPDFVLEQCVQLDELVEFAEMRAALTAPFVAGDEPDEYDNRIVKILLWAMAYDACPRHYDLIVDALKGG